MGLKLLLSTPNSQDATAYYRSVGPLNHLRRTGYDIDFVLTNENPNWTVAAFSDVGLFQRPMLDHQLETIKHFCDQKRPVWVDLDDDLFDVPACNPNRDFIMHPQHQSTLRESLARATVVTVSTAALAEVVRPMCPRVEVIPNAVDTELYPPLPADKPRSKVVMWRGSASHIGDLMAFADAIVAASDAFPDWKFAFMGFNPHWITDRLGSRAQYIPPCPSVHTYMQHLRAISAAVHIVPLVDDRFNRCKSCIAQLEAELAGSVPIVPAFAEWEYGDWLDFDPSYTDPEGFGFALTNCIEGIEFGSPNMALFYLDKVSYLSLNAVNRQRANLLTELRGMA